VRPRNRAKEWKHQLMFLFLRQATSPIVLLLR
jgi:hypothetical protein